MITYLLRCCPKQLLWFLDIFLVIQPSFPKLLFELRKYPPFLLADVTPYSSAKCNSFLNCFYLSKSRIIGFLLWFVIKMVKFYYLFTFLLPFVKISWNALKATWSLSEFVFTVSCDLMHCGIWFDFWHHCQLWIWWFPQ